MWCNSGLNAVLETTILAGVLFGLLSVVAVYLLVFGNMELYDKNVGFICFESFMKHVFIIYTMSKSACLALAKGYSRGYKFVGD